MIPSHKGFYFPAEWRPHRATWLSWPHNQDTWPNGIAKIFPAYAQFIKQISTGEQVCINVRDSREEQDAGRLLKEWDVDLRRISFFYHPTNDAWCRDHGPSFLVNPSTRQKLIVNWDYNAWGGKYSPYDLDDQIPHKIAHALDLPCLNPQIVMEGGAVDFNGEGTLITTRSCLQNPNRNPALSPTEIEQALKDWYGVTQIIWLEKGILGDDTDGHIDDITRFVAPNTVVTMIENDPQDENHFILKENFNQLKHTRLLNGKFLTVIPISLPKPVWWENQRLPASYANFYICNSSVITPTFDDPMDEQALYLLHKLFKGRRVLGIDSRHIIGGLGSFHCLSQQEPAI